VIKGTAGSQADQLKQFDAARLKTIVQQQAAQIGERKLLLAAATEAKTVIPPDQLAQALKAQYDQAAARRSIRSIENQRREPGIRQEDDREDMLIRAFLTKTVFGAIKIEPAEIDKAYAGDKTATVRHILLLTQGKPDAEKPQIRKKMEGILERARKGEDFAALAKEFTEDRAPRRPAACTRTSSGARWSSLSRTPRSAFPSARSATSSRRPTATTSSGRKSQEGNRAPGQGQGPARGDPQEAKQGAAYEAYMTELKAKGKLVEVK